MYKCASPQVYCLLNDRKTYFYNVIIILMEAFLYRPALNCSFLRTKYCQHLQSPRCIKMRKCHKHHKPSCIYFSSRPYVKSLLKNDCSFSYNVFYFTIYKLSRFSSSDVCISHWFYWIKRNELINIYSAVNRVGHSAPLPESGNCAFKL